MAKWIALEQGKVYLTWEPLIFFLFLSVLAFVFRIVFLRSLQKERQQTLKLLFRSQLIHGSIAVLLFLLYTFLSLDMFRGERWVIAFANYVGIITIGHWTYFAMKLARLWIFLALFFSNMRVAFPLLFVNIATLVVSLILILGVVTYVLDVQLAPVLATSAVFSLILGIALQDTLGNLFSGIALQMDKPYTIGDWVEVFCNGQKYSGQVYEISWRATTLVGFGGEMITVANRLMGQSVILNFSRDNRPFFRLQFIKVPYGTDTQRLCKKFEERLLQVDGVSTEIPPLCGIAEITESFVNIKVVYAITSYEFQVAICDRVCCALLEVLRSEGVDIAPDRIMLLTPPTRLNTPDSALG